MITQNLLDCVARERLRQVPSVEVIQRCEVTGLVGKATFVVVATGRNSTVPGRLWSLGLPEPESTYVDAHIGYASRMFRRPERLRNMWRALFVQAAPPVATRARILFPVEGNRWLVTLQGGDRDYPPVNDAGFLEFARSLRSSMLYDQDSPVAFSPALDHLFCAWGFPALIRSQLHSLDRLVKFLPSYRPMNASSPNTGFYM